MTATSSYLNREPHTEAQAIADDRKHNRNGDVKLLLELADRLDLYAGKCDGRYPDSYVGYQQLQAEAASLRTLIGVTHPDQLRAHLADKHTRQYEASMRKAIVEPLMHVLGDGA